jgi:hypothetical protein
VDRERLKLIIKNIELLLGQLKVELLSENISTPIDEISDLSDYDEVFDDQSEI